VYDLTIEFTPRPDRPGFLDAKMLGADAVVFGFLSNVSRSFLAVLVAKGWGQVAFAILTAVDKRNNVIQIPIVLGFDLAFRDMADTAVSLEDAGTDMRRRSAVIGLAPPFRR